MLRIGRGCTAAVLVFGTVAGTFALTAIPFVWILAVSKLSDMVSLPPLVAVTAVLAGIPASMIGGIKLLLVVNELYDRVCGHERTGRVAPVWRRSLSEGPRSSQGRMLDVVMVVVVCCAVVAVLVWLVVHAGTTITF